LRGVSSARLRANPPFFRGLPPNCPGSRRSREHLREDDLKPPRKASHVLHPSKSPESQLNCRQTLTQRGRTMQELSRCSNFAIKLLFF
ncbi:hypothetical protein IscW_ISCW000367, partial [Ixodes scapularis]